MHKLPQLGRPQESRAFPLFSLFQKPSFQRSGLPLQFKQFVQVLFGTRHHHGMTQEVLSSTEKGTGAALPGQPTGGKRQSAQILAYEKLGGWNQDEGFTILVTIIRCFLGHFAT